MVEESIISAGVEYKKIRKILELDFRVFRPCEIKEIEKGFLRKQLFLIHFDGRKWDVLRIGDNEIERYIFNR